jgi:hypothetical protein
MEQSALRSKIDKSSEKWESMNPVVQQSYDSLMKNEPFWSYPGHLAFQRIYGWSLLGNA